MPIFTHPSSKTAGALFDLAVARMGVVPASFWMFSGHEALDGLSPIQAIKVGREGEVERLVLELRKEETQCGAQR